MPLAVRLAASGLLFAIAAAGCQRPVPNAPAAEEPAVARVVMPARTASAPARPGPPPTSELVAAHHAAADASPAKSDAAPVIVAPAEPDPDAGCVASVDELPTAAGLDLADRRLRREGLLVAVKSSRRLMLFSDGVQKGCWRIGLGFAPKGHKEVEGDGRTPEGWYATSDKPWSTFDDAIAIHYPNAADAQAGLRAGRISRHQRDLIVDASARRDVPPQRTNMGGAVLIHGGGSSSDWTLGCIALDDGDLADLRARLPRRMKTDLLVLP